MNIGVRQPDGTFENWKDTHVDAVIERTVLGDGDDHGLMVGRRVDRAETVSTSGETSRDGSGKNAVDTSVIDTLH
jgi:hypothetical protein